MKKPEDLQKRIEKLSNRVIGMEKKLQGVIDEFTDLFDLITAWDAAYHAKSEDQMAELSGRTKKTLRKLVEKYG